MHADPAQVLVDLRGPAGSGKELFAPGDAPTRMQHEGESTKSGCKWSDSEHWSILRSRPRILLISLAVLIVLLVPSVVGVVYAAESSAASAKQLAFNGACQQLAAGIRQKMYTTFWGVKAMASYIRQNPDCSTLNQTFMDMSRDIKTWDVEKNIMFLEADPVSIITYMEPAITNETLWNWLYGYNILRNSSQPWRETPAITSPGGLVFDGPYWQPDQYFGGYAVYGLFLPAESPDQDVGCNAWLGEPYNCPGCWDPVRKLKFWGLIQGQIKLQGLYDGSDPLLRAVADTYRYSLHIARDLHPKDLNYIFLSERWGRGQIALSDPPPRDPVKRDILIENIHWVIEISPISGWSPPWFKGCLAAVILGSFLISVLVLWLLLTMEMQVRSNTRLADSNQALADSNRQLEETTHTLEKEKLASEELVKRQLKLIACLEAPPTKADMDGSFMQGVDDRIEAVRRSIKTKSSCPRGVSSATSLNDDGEIKILDLLGEGTFGKVYKGIWHGTFVAIKSILLPANMSGQAKREKMVIMEAAISSSLSHPNIVQTYTYDIMRHNSADVSSSFASEETDFGSGIVVDGVSTHTPRQSNNALPSQDSKSAMPTVHSYEVRIVLEFCDSGSLREALDNNIFMQNDLFNYRAVLDTVLDISRAILHLHKANVLHGDLKTVNVLLKSAGGEGSGFVAKVADFGLSVQIDKAQTHMSNMFQGTMTHMSPELLLMGQTSRQADVYAFGITMWEVMTAGRPFKGMPLISLGHNIAVQGMRPQWPIAVPLRYRMLAESCWAHAAEERPTMEEVVAQLAEMRAEAGGATPPVNISFHQEKLQRARQEAMNARGAVPPAAAWSSGLAACGVGSVNRPGVGIMVLEASQQSSQPSGGFGLVAKLEEVPEAAGEGEEAEQEDIRVESRKGGRVKI